MTSSNISHITLRELSQRIEYSLNDSSLHDIWIVAEINSINVNQSSGHCYLELIEREAGRNLVSASIKAIIWSSRYRMIADYFHRATSCELSSGQKILCKVSISYHPIYSISVNITDIDPSYTLGENERIKLQTIAQLKEDGVFDMNHLLELPQVIQRLAIVSSPTAAGYGDFMDQIERSAYMFHCTVFTSLMQGEAASDSICEALSEIEQRSGEFDAVVMIRGGGATSDLACFDGYFLSSYIAQMSLPVITGIGHHRDNTVADMVAHISLKTPTAVATFLIDNIADFYMKINTLCTGVGRLAQNFLTNSHKQMDALSSAIARVSTETISAENLKLERIIHTITSRAQYYIASESQRGETLQRNISNSVHLIIEREQHRLTQMHALCHAHNPQRVLERGYSIVTLSDGRLLHKGEKPTPGEVICIESSGLNISSRVESVKAKEKNYRN